MCRQKSIRYRRFLSELVKLFLKVFIWENAKIDSTVYFSHSFGVVIGSDVTIEKKVFIRNNVTIGRKRSHELNPIVIGEGTNIGSSSVILASIGRNCVIGAGAIVTKPVPDNSIAVGNPAKIRKMSCDADEFLNCGV